MNVKLARAWIAALRSGDKERKKSVKEIAGLHGDILHMGVIHNPDTLVSLGIGDHTPESPLGVCQDQLTIMNDGSKLANKNPQTFNQIARFLEGRLEKAIREGRAK